MKILKKILKLQAKKIGNLKLPEAAQTHHLIEQSKGRMIPIAPAPLQAKVM